MLPIRLPQSDIHPMVKLTIIHPEWSRQTTLDDSHKTYHLTPPEGAHLDDIEVIAEFVGRDGEVDIAMRPMLLKEKAEREEENEDNSEGEGEVENEDACEGECESEPEAESGPADHDESADGHVSDSSVAPAGVDDGEVDETSRPVGEAEDKQETDPEPPAEEEVSHRRKRR